MNKIKINWRKDGTCRVEWHGDDFDDDEYMSLDEEGTLGTVDDIPWLAPHPEGIEGNSNRGVRRVHGWRGTTNGVEIRAHGWRRVLETGKLRRGVGRYAILSADLKPDVD